MARIGQSDLCHGRIRTGFWSVDVAVFGTQGAPDEGDPAHQVGAQECVEVLQRALDQLPPKARAAFLLHRRDGLSVDEIAERLSISRPMTKKYLVKALVQFRKALAEAEHG